MTKTDYINKRNALLAEAQTLIDEGKLEDFEAKQKEITDLDDAFDAQAKAEANLRVLQGNSRVSTGTAGDLSGAERLDLSGAPAEDDGDIYASTEYRKAFMGFVLRRTPIPAKFTNADANTKTTDIPVMIPTTIMQKIITHRTTIVGMRNLVTVTHFKGGVQIPRSLVKPVATWVAEGKGSTKQKASIDFISFGYHKLRCAVSMSFEVDVMALPEFENAFAKSVAEAMTVAEDEAIFKGTGNGQPKGILTETPNEGQSITLAADEGLSYAKLVEMEGALPLAYEAKAVWLMTKKTFMGFVGMVDADGQPIARVNYGIGGRPERSLLGRTVILNDNMTSYAESVETDTIVAALYDLADYALNVQPGMQTKYYEDNDTDDMILKAISLEDGMSFDNGSLVTLTKKAATA